MSSLPHSASASNALPKSITTEIRERDWDSYQVHSNRSYGKDFVCHSDSLTAYRQQCALAYLGKRAQKA